MAFQATIPSPEATPYKESGSAARWILFFSAVWCVCWFVHAWHYWEDDAYIHLEFARNVSLGHGYSFNGLLVNGDTSPLWVLLLAAAHAVIPNWLIAGKLLAILGAIVALTGTYFFARRLMGGANGSMTFAAAMVLLLVVNPYFSYWSFSGMETLTALGVAFWAVLIAARTCPRWWSFFLGCFLAGVAPVLRPELLAVTGLAGLLLLAQWWRLPGGKRKAGTLILGLFLVVLPTTLWSVYALHAFGHVLPNTNAAKRADPGDSVFTRLLFVYGLGFPLIIAEIAGAFVLLAKPRWIRRNSAEKLWRMIPAAGWVFVIWCAVGAVFYMVDHTWVQTRYIFVMAPGLMMVMLAFNRLRLPLWVYRASVALALILAVGVDVLTVWPLVRNKAIGDEYQSQVAAYLRNDLPSNAPLAVYSIGELAFDSQHPIIDIGGITRPSVVPYMITGNAGDVVRWAVAQGARYYDSDVQPEPGAVLVYSSRPMPNIGWSLNPKYYSGTSIERIWKLPKTDSAATR